MSRLNAWLRAGAARIPVAHGKCDRARTSRRRARVLGWLLLASTLAWPAGARAELEFLEVMTGGAATESSVPIVVAIHGLGDRPEAFRILLDDLKAKARVILPRAPTPHGNDGGTWFDFHAGDAEMVAGVTRASGEIAELIEALRSRHAWSERVIVTGFSQGGILAFALATARPELVAAAAPVAGSLPIPMWPSARPTFKPLPRITALHGASDDVVPIQAAKWSVEALRSNGYEAELRSYPELGHTVSSQERTDLHQFLVAAVAELTPKPQEGPPAQADAAPPVQADAASAAQADAAPPVQADAVPPAAQANAASPARADAAPASLP